MSRHITWSRRELRATARKRGAKWIRARFGPWPPPAPVEIAPAGSEPEPPPKAQWFDFYMHLDGEWFDHLRNK